MKLQEIATIQTGTFTKTVAEGEVVYLQARHFDEFGNMDSDLLHPDLKLDNLTQKHLLKPGDVLFAAKGIKNFATVYEAHNPPAVASTTFFVIRLQDTHVMPAYVTWVLNNPDTQFYLKRSARGSSMVSISKSVLEDLDIPIPDLKTQMTILNIARLRKAEKFLKEKIEALREMQIQQQIINAIKKYHD